MTEKEKLMWQQLVDESYMQFIRVVEEGRPTLKGKLQEDVRIDETIPVRTEKGPTQTMKFTRYRADGGVYTAPDALKLGLVDQIGYLDDAIEAARKAANLGTSFKAVRYEKPLTILGMLLGIKAPASGPSLELGTLANSMTPRLWYLAPGAGPTGLLAASKKE
jgi:protease-4